MSCKAALISHGSSNPTTRDRLDFLVTLTGRGASSRASPPRDRCREFPRAGDCCHEMTISMVPFLGTIILWTRLSSQDRKKAGGEPQFQQDASANEPVLAGRLVIGRSGSPVGLPLPRRIFKGRNSGRQRPRRDLARPRKMSPHHLTPFDAHGQPRDRRFAIPINLIERNGASVFCNSCYNRRQE